MSLSPNEIRTRAARFASEWKDARYERGETHTFYNDCFDIFGVNRRRVASYEEPVRLLGKNRGFIDLFWKGVLIVEQKSEGKDLTRARQQALEYFPGLKDHELPRYLLVSDFRPSSFTTSMKTRASDLRSTSFPSTSTIFLLSAASKNGRLPIKILLTSQPPSSWVSCMMP